MMEIALTAVSLFLLTTIMALAYVEWMEKVSEEQYRK